GPAPSYAPPWPRCCASSRPVPTGRVRGWVMPPYSSPPAHSGGTGAMASTLDFEAPLMRLQEEITRLRGEADGGNADAAGKVAALEQRLEQEMVELYTGLTPWQKVQIARHPERPYTLDYIRWACSDFVELHGDRRFGDD